MTDPPRQSHLIRRRDVATWLADSVVKRITVHWTSVEDARDIRRMGVRIEASSVSPRWGRGFYTSTRPLPEYGDVGVRVAIRLRSPLVVDDQLLALEQIDDLLVRAGSEDIREVLLAAGYDGVVIHWGSGEMWVVAFANEQVKIVVE